MSIFIAPNNTIGGANTIAFNSGPGVQVNGSNARGNSILSNSIYSNTGGGIVLTGGANNNQAAPTLTAAASSGGTTTLSGTLNSTPNATFTVQFFANAAPDPSGSARARPTWRHFGDDRRLRQRVVLRGVACGKPRGPRSQCHRD